VYEQKIYRSSDLFDHVTDFAVFLFFARKIQMFRKTDCQSLGCSHC